MSENCHQVYQEMTGQKVQGLKVGRLEPPFSAIQYKTAIVIPYENKAEQFEGRFVLGFNDERMAVRLAGAIAAKTGMPDVDQMDDFCTDILFEFMNTVSGRVVSDWDKFGMNAVFAPPEFIADLRFDSDPSGDLLIYAVTLLLPDEESITILTSLEEIEKNPLKGKKVLVVDDSKMIRFLLTKEFEKQGCRVSEASNGLDGFIKNQADQPDLIIMDLIMPKMGGLEAIAGIRDMNPTVHIIVLTSTSKKDEVAAAAALKVKGYIKKPVQMEQLLTLAKSCFQ
jgi:CheY-like chemotaxis protein/CheY-specific phosphatase CheX